MSNKTESFFWEVGKKCFIVEKKILFSQIFLKSFMILNTNI